MTKVYEVVRVMNYYGLDTRETVNIFTNKRLAKAQAEYWTLKRKKAGLKIHYEVIEWEICKLDYSKGLLEEQMEKLPY